MSGIVSVGVRAVYSASPRGIARVLPTRATLPTARALLREAVGERAALLPVSFACLTPVSLPCTCASALSLSLSVCQPSPATSAYYLAVIYRPLRNLSLAKTVCRPETISTSAVLHSTTSSGNQTTYRDVRDSSRGKLR